MLINGIPVSDELVGQLAAFLGRDDQTRTAERLRRGATAETAEVELDPYDLDALFGAIDECPSEDELLQLRAGLLAQHDARLRHGRMLRARP